MVTEGVFFNQMIESSTVLLDWRRFLQKQYPTIYPPILPSLGLFICFKVSFSFNSEYLFDRIVNQIQSINIKSQYLRINTIYSKTRFQIEGRSIQLCRRNNSFFNYQTLPDVLSPYNKASSFTGILLRHILYQPDVMLIHAKGHLLIERHIREITSVHPCYLFFGHLVHYYVWTA